MGAGFLWVSLSFVGVVYAHKLKNRISLLDKTRNMISQIKTETEYLHLPINDIIDKLSASSQTSELDYISDCNKLIKDGLDFPVAWKTALHESSLDYMIDEKDKLLQLGENFGTSDMNNQLLLLSAYDKYFEEFLIRAKEEYNKRARTASLMGILLGCMLFIMLI